MGEIAACRVGCCLGESLRSRARHPGCAWTDRRVSRARARRRRPRPSPAPPRLTTGSAHQAGACSLAIRASPCGRSRPAAGLRFTRTCRQPGSFIASCTPARPPHAWPPPGRMWGSMRTAPTTRYFSMCSTLRPGTPRLHHLIGNTCLPGTGGSDNVCGINPCVLAPNGWAAELEEGGQGGYPDTEPGNGVPNAATDASDRDNRRVVVRHRGCVSAEDHRSLGDRGLVAPKLLIDGHGRRGPAAGYECLASQLCPFEVHSKVLPLSSTAFSRNVPATLPSPPLPVP